MFYKTKNGLINIEAIVYITIHKNKLQFNMLDHEVIEVEYQTQAGAKRELERFINMFDEE